MKIPFWRIVLVIPLFWLPFFNEAAGRTYSALVIEAETNRVLYSDQADALRHPASLTKMMTLLLAFDAIETGRLSYGRMLPVSRHAASRAPSSLGLRAGDYVTVEDCIYGLVTRSANDAASTLAEAMGYGSEDHFATLMTQRARSLGMVNTVFMNASGLPDPDQVTTATDMAILARTLVRQYPTYYRYFSTPSFRYKNREFRNHNHLLETYSGTDGLKTGFINASGYNLVASARRDGRRLIGVVFGGRTAAARDAHMRDLLDVGFELLDGRNPTTRLADASDVERPDPPPMLLRAPSKPKLEPLPRSSSKQRSERIAEARGKGVPDRKTLTKTAKAEKNPREKEKKSSTDNSRWLVQVGTFQKVELAQSRINQAKRLAPQAFNQARPSVASYAKSGKKLYRAYLSGLSWDQAKTGCQTLKRKQIECSMVANS